MKQLKFKFWLNAEKRLIDINRVCLCRAGIKATVYNIPAFWDELTPEQKLLVKHTEYFPSDGVLIIEVWEDGKLKSSEEFGERIL